MKFPTMEEMAKDVAEKALDEYIYEGNTIRQWVEILKDYENKKTTLERILERLEALRAEHEEREKDARKVGLTEHADLNGIKAYIYDDAIDIVKEEMRYESDEMFW